MSAPQDAIDKAEWRRPAQPSQFVAHQDYEGAKTVARVRDGARTVWGIQSHDEGGNQSRALQPEDCEPDAVPFD